METPPSSPSAEAKVLSSAERPRAIERPPSDRRRISQRIRRDALTVAMLVVAIGYTASLTRPIYTGRAPVVGQVIKEVAPPPDVASAAPTIAEGTLADSIAAIEKSPEFAQQKERFAADLVHTGRMSAARADSIARFAVREAFLRGIPPAVIFGVMLTENAQFISQARSNVGAVGLMQVYPKVWLKELSRKFGASNIAADSTNLRYGVFILSTYLKPRDQLASTYQHLVSTTPGTLMQGLLHYNGCVRGTNTPHCHTYPNKVQQFVEQGAHALCGGKDFYQCIAKPFMAGLLGRANVD